MTNCDAIRSCSLGKNLSFDPFTLILGVTAYGRSLVYVVAEFAPLKTARSAFATT